MRIRPTRNKEEEEAVFICDSMCSELPNWCRAVRSPLSVVWLRGQRSCYVCDCESTVDVMINYILWMTRQYRVKENEGSRTPPLYSLPCLVHRLFVSWQPSCVAVDGVVLAGARCRPCLLLVFIHYSALLCHACVDPADESLAHSRRRRRRRRQSLFVV